MTAGNQRLRVFLNGEPCPAAIAASDREGWVMLHAELRLQPVPVRTRDPLGMAYRADPLDGPRKIFGRVTLILCACDD